MQNNFNVAHRGDAALVDSCAEQGIAYVPFFPLGGFSPVRGDPLTKVAERHGVSTSQIALAWLLQRSPTLLLVPGTRSRGHLEDNLGAGSVELSADDLADLDALGSEA